MKPNIMYRLMQTT